MGRVNNVQDWLKNRGAMALLIHLGTAVQLHDHHPDIIEFAELADDLYNIVDEDAKFDAKLDDLDEIWDKTKNQIEYYQGLNISYNNFIGEWEDRDGELVSGDTSNKFNGGAKIDILFDGTWTGAGSPGTAWWNLRNSLNLVVDDGENNFTRLVDGHLIVESPNNKKYILQHSPKYVIIEDKKHRTDAKLYCQSIGRHLATIASQEEQDELSALLGNHSHVWIGFNDMNDEGNWKWESGAPVTYTNWADFPTQQPDNYAGVEHCAMMYADRDDKVWNDRSCDALTDPTLAFVCSKH